MDNSTEELIRLDNIKNFKMHYRLLLRRYRRFKEIYRIDNTDIDVITYFDMIIVQLRAMCIESLGLKHNFTAQNILKSIGRDDLADKIDKMLDEELLGDLSIRKALKIVADKLVCHYDYFDTRDSLLSICQTIEGNLQNPYVNENLDHIMGVLIDAISEGLGFGMDDLGNEDEIRQKTFSWDI